MKKTMLKRIVTLALVLSMTTQNIAAYAGQMTSAESAAAESEMPAYEETVEPETAESEVLDSSETEQAVYEETEPAATEEIEPEVADSAETAVLENEDAAAAEQESADLQASSVSDFTYEELNGSFVTITGYSGTDTEVVIPSVIGEYTVQEIAAKAFQNNTSITSVAVPSTVLVVRNYAFAGCSSLESISFENAFYLGTKMGGAAFDRVGSLEKGYRFNAIVIDGIEDEGFPMDATKRIERFCYHGDDRNIVARYIDGKPIRV
jgi:hypothetical protein